MKTMRDTGVLFGRGMKHILRSPDTIITVTIMPIAMMLMFVFVFGGAVKMSMSGDVNYVNYQLPGILLITISTGSAYTAARIYADRQNGLFSRFRTMPTARASVLLAHVLSSLVSNAISLALIVLVAFLLGFRPGAGIPNGLAVAGILALFTLALTQLAILLGLRAKSAEGASAFSYPLIFLPFLSSAFVPTETMPAALRVFAENQPVTHIAEAIRALLNAEPVGNELPIALAWCAGIAVVTQFFATRAYRRRGARPGVPAEQT
jgi:ABC-2 type transport system permease protein